MRQTDVDVGLLWAECRQCGHRFEIPWLGNMRYGEKMFRTVDGLHSVYVNCFEDELFQDGGKYDLEDLIDTVSRRRTFFRRRSGEVFDLVFVMTCDAVQGSELTCGTPICPKCQSHDIHDNQYSPPKVVTMTLPVATHEAWKRKPQDERLRLIEARLKEIKKNKLVGW